jgi:hypothetical protein
MNRTPIFRAHTEIPGRRKSKKRASHKRPRKWPPYALVFDCETRTDELQSLTFGSFRLLRNVYGGDSEVLEEGLFYDPDELSPSEVRVLTRYAARKRAATSSDAVSHKLLLLAKPQFIRKVFFPHAEAGSLIVGFNLPFDLSRIASDARPATRVNQDWSLLFRNPHATPDALQKDEFRIKVDRKDGKVAFLALSGCFKKRGRFRSSGRFLDLFAFAWSLTNTSYTLKGLARDLRKKGYKVPRKFGHEPTGRVTPTEIAYCRQDVRVTTGILNALRTEFDRHRDISLYPDNAMSPASIFKAYLQGMGIQFPSQKFRLSSKIQGIAAQAYYGGRSEVRIRCAEVPVVHTDFLSEYPTAITLMGLWRLIIAKRLRIDTVTQEVKSLLAQVLRRPDSAFEPALWEKFAGYALIDPRDDVLPIRTEYNENSDDKNIGVNILERADRPIWYAIPDLVDSVLLAGKVPTILKAIRVVPEGKQKGLRPIALRGKEQVDPILGNLFKSLIEAKERAKKQDDEEQAYFLKIMANSGYGIFIETTPRRVSKSVRVKVFSGEHQHKTKSQFVEDNGKFYCPVIASLITAGGRLLLGLLEYEVTKAGGTYLFCDTDSMAIAATSKGGSVRLTDPEDEKQQRVKALSRDEVEKIIVKFERLNPYSFRGSILKVEMNSLKRQLYGFGVSAKRYCLYDGRFNVVHASSHGLGHLFVPGAKWNKKIEAHEWVKEAWEFIIKNDPHAKSPFWFSLPAMMRVAMTTPKVQMWRVIQEKQTNLPYRLQMKPSNFVVSPILDRHGDEIHSDGFPKEVNRDKFMLVAPFTSKSRNLYKLRYTNVHDGKQYDLVPLARKRDSDASPSTLEHMVRMHQLHAESKSLAPDGTPCTMLTKGLLLRTPVTAEGNPRFTAKESDRKWEQEEDPSLFEPMLVEYRPNETARITTDATLRNKIRNCGITVRELATRTELNSSTIQNARMGKRIRKSSAAKIWRLLKWIPVARRHRK